MFAFQLPRWGIRSLWIQNTPDPEFPDLKEAPIPHTVFHWSERHHKDTLNPKGVWEMQSHWAQVLSGGEEENRVQGALGITSIMGNMSNTSKTLFTQFYEVGKQAQRD